MYETTSDKIINASINLFSIKGYAETSIRDIAKEAGIKTSTIYYHFKYKEEILNLILSEYTDMVRKNVHRKNWQVEKELVISGVLEKSARDIMNYMFFNFVPPNIDRHRKMVKIICSESVRNDSVHEYFRTQGDYSFNYIKSILDALITAGRIPKCDTVKLSAVLYSISFAFMHFDSMEIHQISKDADGTDMFSVLEYILKIVMEGSI